MRIWFVVFSFLAGQLYAHADYADLVERLSHSVVNISTKTEPKERPQTRQMPNPFEGTPFEDLFRGFGGGMDGFQFPQVPQQSLGSGVLIDQAGYIVTNNHVVEGADEILVKFNGERDEHAADLVGRDAKNDLALLKLKDRVSNPPARLGDSSKLRPGQPVIAIGNPFGLGGTVTSGIVSALSRNIGQGPYDDFIQTDAAINPGNSGGPLFNEAGEVVGINAAILTRTGGSNGIGFAIPINTVKLIVEQIKTHGRPIRGWLGVRIQHVTKALASSLNLPDDIGALVAEVIEESPAAAAGIKVGDVILRYDGKKIEQMADLPRLVAETKVGGRVGVEIMRGTTRKIIQVKIAELDEEEDVSVPSQQNTTQKPEKMLGLQLKPLSRELRNQLDVPSTIDGLVVADVAYGSPAFEAGIRRGDVLVEANMKRLTNAADLRREIEKAAEGKAILIRLYREDGFLFVPLKTAE
jgi:serine protease Do